MSYDANALLDIKHGYECPECGCKDNIRFSMRAKDKVALRCGNCGKRFGVIDAERKIHQRITNADAIRAMSNEELANWLNTLEPNDPPQGCDYLSGTGCNRESGFCDCIICWLEWLSNEAEDK